MACHVNGTSGESVSASISWFRDSDRTWDWGKGYKHHDNQTWLFMQVYIYCDVRQRKKEFLQTDISKSLNLNQIKKKKKKDKDLFNCSHDFARKFSAPLNLTYLTRQQPFQTGPASCLDLTPSHSKTVPTLWSLL